MLHGARTGGMSARTALPALMLSAESASGDYPIEAVAMI